MESGDLLTLAGGLVIVILIALLANPQQFSGMQAALPPVTAVPVPTARSVQTTATPVYHAPTPLLPVPDAPPYRIFYTGKPFSYPVVKLPANMETYGASDIPWRDREMVTFAYLEDTRGGLTQTFSVPYPVWIINTTVNATRTPQYGNFRMALLYAANGTIIEGEEIQNLGTAYRIVQTSNTDMYMIISTQYIDRYHIRFETPRKYYDTYRPR